MKRFKTLAAALTAIVATTICFPLAACGASGKDGIQYGGGISYEVAGGNYVYNTIEELDFSEVSKQPSSYFSLDRNTATYSLVRSQINAGRRVAADSVRIEEMINYFDYGYSSPEDQPIALSGYLSDCPWNSESKLMLVGLKTQEARLKDAPNHYVVLIDVSGSMSGADRLGLAQTGLYALIDGLTERDRVSIVTYASGVRKVLDGEICTDENKAKIKAAVSDLNAYGATNGSGGLELAYRTAEEYFVENGNNRILLISDGDFNVGMTSQTSLKNYVRQKAATGIYLSVIGVGMGNMRDDILETLATCGNGNYAYLDTELEARKVFTEELGGMLYTVAQNARANATFTNAVSRYRLIGYDTKRLTADEYEDSDRDTGEIGSNLCVSALYEIQLNAEYAGDSNLLAQVEVRYQDASVGNSEMSSVQIGITSGLPSSDDLNFISCVAEFGLILRQSAYGGCASIADVLSRLNGLSSYLEGDEYKKEFVNLVGKASEIGYSGIDRNQR